MRRQPHIVLMAEQAQITHPVLAGVQPTLPAEPFLSAAGTNWGVAWLDPDLDSIVRRHWPFPSPGPYPSLPWTAARLAGAPLNETPQERWLRYYGRDDAWTTMSYRFALTQPANYFRGQIVFIGTAPKTSLPDGENDKFSTPYTRWTGEATGGVEILITSFLNLVNGDWLQRPAGWLEALAMVTAGLLLGGGLCRMRLPLACALAVGVVVVVAFRGHSWSYFTHYWFPVAGDCRRTGTLRSGLGAGSGNTSRARKKDGFSFPDISRVAATIEELPDAPGYKLFNPPFGEGAYGKVWLARNPAGQWRALKAVYLANFDQNVDPYDREFNGIKKYQPISDKHPGLLRVEFVSEKQAGYFYYIMELGDPLKAGWEQEPSTYKPRDLVNERARTPGGGCRCRNVCGSGWP